jgi:CheY-like chemotaxis protein
MKPTTITPIKIALFEDNEGDILLTKELFKEGKLANSLFTIKDGQSAIKFLEKQEEFLHAETPDLILLDINLPKVNGLEILAHIRNSEKLKNMSVCILSSSSSPSDINTAKKLHASYIQKPIDVADFITMATQKDFIWVSLVKISTLN